MKVLSILVALFGAALSFEVNRQYTYFYQGLSHVGIKGTSNERALVGLRTTVRVQVEDQATFNVKFDNVQVANDLVSFTGGMNGYPNHPIPFQPARGSLILLEKPFKVARNRNQPDRVMEVDKSEHEWITNIRKSVADILTSDSLTRTNNNGQLDDHYRAYENTLYGECESIYTTNSLPHQFLPLGTPTPADRTTTGIPPYRRCQEGAYNVTRTIDFNRCRDRPVIQIAGVANRTNSVNSTNHAQESRTSTTFYVICGRPGNFQLQNVTSQGYFGVNPYGYETDKIESITNQTLRIRSITDKYVKFTFPTLKPVNTRLWTVVSPYSKDQYETLNRRWVKYSNEKKERHFPYMLESTATGIVYDGQVDKFKQEVINLIEETARIILAKPEPAKSYAKLEDTAECEGPTHMRRATRILRSLKYEVIKQIIDHFFDNNSAHRNYTTQLVVDAAASSGSTAGVKAVLDAINKHKLSDVRVKSIFMTFSNNIVNPSAVDDIIEYIRENIERIPPFVFSTIVVNAGSAIRRYCTDNNQTEYSVPKYIFGNNKCNKARFLENRCQFLGSQILNSGAPYQKASYLEAIANIGHKQCYGTLRDAARGVYGRDPNTRVIGVYSFLRFRNPDLNRREVEYVLASIYNNFQEDVQLRQTAVLVQASWNPSMSFWMKMAQLTWRDPSRQFGSFIYSLLKSKSTRNNDRSQNRQSEYATHAIARAKPYSPSYQYSNSYTWYNLAPHRQLRTEFSFTRINANESALPREIFTYLYNSYGGLDYTAFEYCVYFYNMDEILYSAFTNNNHRRSGAGQRSATVNQYVNYAQIIRDQLKFAERKYGEPRLVQSLRFFNGMQAFVPIDATSLQQSNYRIDDLFALLTEGTDFALIKYFDPLPIEVVIPNEMGLPLTYRLSYPTLFSTIGDARLSVDNKQNPNLRDIISARNITLRLRKMTKYTSTYIANVGHISPWDERETYAKVHMTTNLNGPANLQFTLAKLGRDFSYNSSISSVVSTNQTSPYPIVHAHNKPVIGVRDMWPTQSVQREVQLYTTPTSPVVRVRFNLPQEYLGVTGYVNYLGDRPNPFKIGSVLDLIRNPHRLNELHSPTSKYWDYQVVIDPSKSDSNRINFTTSTWFPRMPVPLPAEIDNEVRTLPEDVVEGYPSGFKFEVIANGRKERRYDVKVGFSEQEQTSDHYRYNTRIAMHHSPLSAGSQPGAFCLDLNTTTNAIYDRRPLKKLLDSDKEVETVYDGTVYMGDRCQGNSVGEFYTKLRITDRERQRLREEMAPDGTYTPNKSQRPLFDRINYRITYKQEKMSRTVLNASYAAYDVIRGEMYPYISFDYLTENQRDVVHGHADRTQKTNQWNGFAKIPSSDVLFENQKICPTFTRVLPPEQSTRRGRQCVIERNTVRTFDNVRYRLRDEKTSSCWTVAAVNKLFPERLQILTRRVGDQQQILVASSDNRMNIEVNHRELKVNGQPTPVPNGRSLLVRDPNNQAFAEVVRIQSTPGFIISVVNNITVEVMERRANLQPFANLKGYLNGICGDYNTDYANDFIGPKNCFYNKNHTLFAQAWTLNNGQGCDSKTWERQLVDVKQFQDTCTHAYSGRTDSPKFHSTGECKNWPTETYPIFEDNLQWCVAGYNHVDVCLHSTPCKVEEVEILYYCFTKSLNMPDFIRKNLARGYMLSPPPHHGDMYSTRTVTNHISCH